MSVRAIVLDIEGTTTSIAFVYEVLFPYARANVERFLREHWDAPEVQADVRALEALCTADLSAGLAAPPILADENSELRIASVVANLLWQMELDRKSTALKSIQGKIWAGGYARGEIQGHVYPDVPASLMRWKDSGLTVAIYSSGSIEAQRLIFGHTVFGSLLPNIAQHFDTTTGPKTSATSYETISAALGLSSAEVVFCTDVVAEADAAAAAGMTPVVLLRPGNKPQPAHAYRAERDFLNLP